MNIILEGVDCSGKSTLAQALSMKAGLKVFAEPRKHDISFLDKDNYSAYAFGSIMSTVELLRTADLNIKDRLHLSEVVYSKLYGRPSHVSFAAVDEALVASKIKTVLVLLEVDYETYAKRTLEKKEHVNTREVFTDERTYFARAYDASNLPKITMFAKEHVDVVMNHLMKFLVREAM